MAYSFHKPNHINILECHAFRTLLYTSPGDVGLVVFQDSMVTLGATAKGRNSSKALNQVLRQCMAIALF